MTLRFDGRVALITGAGTGLGRAYAEWFAARGARVVVNNRVHPGTPSSAEAVVEAIRAAGGQAIADHHAVDREQSGLAMVEAAYSAFGRLDILIANAGGNVKKPLLETSLTEFRQNLETNFWGSVYPVLAALPRFFRSNYGRIVLTTSAAGLFGQRQHVPYAAAKSALVGFARALAVEIGKQNVKVNLISPYARTPGSRHAIGERLEQIMSPQHVAPVVGWLAHESCEQTGVILSAGAGRVRRVAVVEGSILETSGDDEVGSLWPRLSRLESAQESRNSGRSALELVPELAPPP
jgi:NAD(P)-dependent dehydrogenase (short-subunit alcohol dehydrogenase family)